MGELTTEQQKALALAEARRRKAEADTPQQSKAEGAFDAFTQGASFGFGDELTGIEAGLLGRHPDGRWFDYSGDFSSRYEAARDAERGQRDRFAEENPALSIGSNIAGALATGVGAGRAGLTLMQPGQGLGKAIAAGATEGGIYGSLYGAGEADEGDRLEGALYGFGGGAAVGGPLAGGMHAITGALTRSASARAAAAPALNDLKAGADAAYGKARAINPVFDKFDDFVMQAYRTLPDEGYHASLHPKIKVLLDRVEELSRNGTAPDFKSLEQLRLLSRAAASSQDASERRLGQMFRGALDNFMESAAANGTPATQEGLNAVQEGRKLYQQFKKGELIQSAVEMAKINASQYSQSGFENALRLEFRKLARAIQRGKVRGLSQEEVDAIRLIADGGPIENVGRWLGKFAPTSSVQSLAGAGVPFMVGNAFGGPIAGAAAAGGVSGIGMAGRVGATALQRRNAAIVDALMRNGGSLPAPAPAQLSGPQKAIIRALSGQAGSITAR